MKRMIPVFAALALAMPLRAQDAADAAAENERQARLQQAQEHVERLEVRLADSSDVVERVDRPLLVFGDSARSNADGTLWAWGKQGRPLALVEAYHNTTSGGPWISAVTLTSTRRVSMTTPGAQKWQPEKTQIEPRPLDGAPVPDEKETIRLRQLKDQARRFTAHEFWDPGNSRFELRLLVQPVHRYHDDKAGLQDGAMFVLAHGTNPEVVLLIEALGKSLDEARWHYSLARMGSAELHVEIDGKEMWKRDRTPGVVGQPRDPYWLFVGQSAAPRPPAPNTNPLPDKKPNP